MRSVRFLEAGASTLLALVLQTASTQPVFAQEDVITTAVGGGPNDIPAVQSDVNQPNAVAVDAAGNYYIAAYGAYRVYKVDTSGTLTIAAGYGTSGYTGDGVPGGALSAKLNSPSGVAVDESGNIYISDYNNCVVRKVDTTNTITTIAGTGACGYTSDYPTPVQATGARLNSPRALALDTSGNLYIADYGNCRIRKMVLATGMITTVAGSGACSFSGDGGPANSAGIANPGAVSVDNAGDIFIGDFNSYRIREVTVADGNIYTVAGNGTNGDTGDGGAAISAEIGQQYQGLAVDPTGTTVTIADTTHDVIRQFTVSGIPNTGDITRVAGSGAAGYSGDGGSAIAAKLDAPKGVAVSNTGLIYIADNSNNRIRAFTVNGVINTTAGNGSDTFPTLVSGFPPSGVVFNNPNFVLEDPSGNVFVSEYSNCMVRELVSSTGLVNIFAGSAAAGAVTGTCGFSGEDGPATSAQLGNVEDTARDSAGNIYIADYSNCVVWEVSAATGDISIFAGAGPPKSCGYSGDGSQAVGAKLNGPTGVFVDRKNNVYVGDYNNNRIREVSGGIINTIAGNGTPGYLGDGDPATVAELRNPFGVAVDSAGDVYIADYNNCVVREVTAATGIITTVAGTGTCGFNGDGIATEHDLNHPARLHLDANNNLFISDNNNQRVRWLSPAGILTTIAGNGTAGLNGDGGPALSAEFNGPNGIAQDATGNYLIADYNNLRVREVTAFTALNTSASSLDLGLVTVGSTSTPQVLFLSALGSLTFSNISISAPFTEWDDCGIGLSNGAFCVMYVYLKPTAAGEQTGAIGIEDNGFFSNTTSVGLTGIGSAISVSGGPLNFDTQAVGTTSAAKRVIITNAGSLGVTMGSIAVNDADFVVGGSNCPAPGSALAGGASCVVYVVFRPKTTGAKKGALLIKDGDPSSPQIVGMSGYGTSQVVLNPSSIAFPTQPVGQASSPIKVTLTNNTGGSITMQKPAVAATAPFSVGTGPTSCRAGQVITAGGFCFIYAQFTPTAVGFPTGTLSVFDSDATSPQTVALSGTATGVEFTPVSVTFVPTQVGHAAPSVSVGITNVGTSTVSFTSRTIEGGNSQDFSTNLGLPPCGGSLAPGATCNFSVNFTPSLVGSESAYLVVYDDSTGSPQSLVLGGTGQ